MNWYSSKVINLQFRKLLKKFLLVVAFAVIGFATIIWGIVLGIDLPSGAILVAVGSALFAIGLVTQVSELLLSKKIFEIMMLYGDYREHGIQRFFPSREDPEYQSMRNEKWRTAVHIRILTQIGREYLESGEKLEATKKRVKDSVEFKFCALKPNCPHWTLQYEDFEPADAVVVGQMQKKLVTSNFEELKDLAESLESEEKEFRYTDRKLVFQIEMFDQTLFIGFYGLQSRAAYSPILMFEEKPSSPLYRYFIEQFDKYWKREETND